MNTFLYKKVLRAAFIDADDIAHMIRICSIDDLLHGKVKSSDVMYDQKVLF